MTHDLQILQNLAGASPLRTRVISALLLPSRQTWLRSSSVDDVSFVAAMRTAKHASCPAGLAGST
ncbi:hypothetical protein [Nannocystis sp. SCPEA4]|uniref:hypothetical protein n=1 Tax=Nannocystis sp. SCPEA4 TaxID=2996787 RepID=UPI00226D8AE6|nr:hypothetical protein [Nannocystis sp. SCPEA4]MCY1054023.1 hypothetical protein [Nannocystis sp. SCPEA4]